jgi:para-nitrobenzyl esterase
MNTGREKHSSRIVRFSLALEHLIVTAALAALAVFIFAPASAANVPTALVNIGGAGPQSAKFHYDAGFMAKARPKFLSEKFLRGLTDPAIVTESGPLKGTSIFGVLAYLGIPYAAPPVGTLRWMPPRPYGKWHGVFQANNFGNFCTQPDGAGGTFGDEDCLTLNVFTPDIKKNSLKNWPLPVMVWIHGGGLVTGGSPTFDPSPLVLQGNVIVVTLNYRLGYLGFFAHSAIDSENHLNGNYGLMDQQLALRWVQKNIAAFGGDPRRVTIFGESAGAQSVYGNLVSPTAEGLFRGAIAESGAYLEFQDYYDYIIPTAVGETLGTPLVPSGDQIASFVGCSGASDTAACLRAVSASALALTEPGTIYLFVDGTVLPETPTEAFASGEFNRVPVISGGNHDEERIFVAGQYDFQGNPILTSAEYDAALAAVWGASTPAIEPSYPYAAYPNGGLALSASETDGIFACPERSAVRLLSQYITTYAYEFNDENAPDLFDPIQLATFPLGAYHFSEVQYLFDLDERFTGTNPFTADQQQLSNTMIGYWTHFASTGSPNYHGAPAWAPYNSGSDVFQSLVPPTPMPEATFATDHQCSTLWGPF